MTKTKLNIRKLTGIGIFTAIVIVLQLVGTIKFGTFAISTVLIPIVIGAALYGWQAGAWLGLVFGAAVLLSGDASTFLAINPFGTVVTVLMKGALAGLVSGIVYRVLSKKNLWAGAITAAVVCPMVNTGVFLIGCLVFFYDTMVSWSGGTNVIQFMLISFVGLNFVVELSANLLLSPVIVRILNIFKNKIS